MASAITDEEDGDDGDAVDGASGGAKNHTAAGRCRRRIGAVVVAKCRVEGA